MNGIAFVALVVIVAALSVAVVIVWDRLVGTALVGLATGAIWTAARSKGRWRFWPVVILVVIAVIAAFVVAILIS